MTSFASADADYRYRFYSIPLSVPESGFISDNFGSGLAADILPKIFGTKTVAIQNTLRTYNIPANAEDGYFRAEGVEPGKPGAYILQPRVVAFLIKAVNKKSAAEWRWKMAGSPGLFEVTKWPPTVVPEAVPVTPEVELAESGEELEDRCRDALRKVNAYKTLTKQTHYPSSSFDYGKFLGSILGQSALTPKQLKVLGNIFNEMASGVLKLSEDDLNRADAMERAKEVSRLNRELKDLQRSIAQMQEKAKTIDARLAELIPHLREKPAVSTKVPVAFSHKEPCPACGSLDNLARYTDGSAYCFGCTHHERPTT